MPTTLDRPPTPSSTRTVSATEARVHLGEMVRAVTKHGPDNVIDRSGRPEVVMISIADCGQRRGLHSKADLDNWAARTMDMHCRIAEQWQGPGLTAKEVDDMMYVGQR